ncbi:MAG TPA: DUF1206 domain-containing protein [Pyrinomonadaceae bacterium]|jgi:Na+/proline symporter|nr:DUF1206 domain-containing protein [Pyrinomonadaceae bacterium]
MTETSERIEQAKDKAEETIDKVATSRWVERLARFGYATKGLVYIVVGVLATLTAMGSGERPKDTYGALHSIALQPFGEIMIGVVAFGLIGYVLWRWVQAIADTDDKGNDLKGLSIRVGYGFSGLAYAALALTAAQILFHTRGDDRGDARKDWTAWLMSWPYGRWVVGLAGLGVVAFGLYQIYKGYKAKFRKRLKLGEMGEAENKWGTLIGRVGYAARGIVFCIVGFFLIQAALHYNASEVQGLDGALQSLARQSFGPWILGAVALGLVAYGLYMFVEARHRDIAGS